MVKIAELSQKLRNEIRLTKGLIESLRGNQILSAKARILYFSDADLAPIMDTLKKIKEGGKAILDHLEDGPAKNDFSISLESYSGEGVLNPEGLHSAIAQLEINLKKS